jgi:hypothetical protein
MLGLGASPPIKGRKYRPRSLAMAPILAILVETFCESKARKFMKARHLQKPLSKTKLKIYHACFQ